MDNKLAGIEDIRLTPEKRKEIVDKYYRENLGIDDNILSKSIANAATGKAWDKATELKNPFVGYVGVAENIRMAKEQGFERYREVLKSMIKE